MNIVIWIALVEGGLIALSTVFFCDYFAEIRNVLREIRDCLRETRA